MTTAKPAEFVVAQVDHHYGDAKVENVFMSFGRSPKEAHLDTILYEINRLRFALNKLLIEGMADGPDKDLMIEASLLHYRNLIDFFTGHVPRDGGENLLKITEPAIWAQRSLTAKERGKLDWIRKEAKGQAKRYRDDIAPYLQHMTTKRIEDKDWPLPAMSSEIEPLMSAFLEMFPDAAVAEPGAAYVVSATVDTAAYHTGRRDSRIIVRKPE